MFSSQSFIVFSLRFRPLIHLIWVFVYRIRVQPCSFHVNIHVPKHTLLKRLSFSPLSSLGSLVEDPLGVICVKSYFQALYSTPLVYMSVFMSAPNCFDYHTLCNMFWNLEVWDSPSLFFFSKIVYGCSGSTESPYKHRHWFLYFSKKCPWGFGMDYSESVDHLGYYGHCKDEQIFRLMNLGWLSIYLCLL